ncbi:DUF6946 family protein [Undibacterium arcticum]|uniref:DUF6946 family protein n=1 Tax=Undibacterium arcticum TaxID=1762892 RepID=A0ABV7F7I7_9BURK
MKRIFVPTAGARDWQRLLAKPMLHWKKGRSAMTTAACWEAMPGQLPVEVKAILDSSNEAELTGLQLLAALPEWEVPLPGGARSSFTDVLALASNNAGLVAVAVEAKVDEAFGPTLREKRADPSDGVLGRISYLHEVLRRESPLDDQIRYQLLHRTASALLTATDFHASAAVMLVHSFSPTARWREDFDAFSSAMGATPLSDNLSVVPGFAGPKLYLAWCAGNQAFLDDDLG